VKRAALGGFGLVVVGREPLEVAPNDRNAAYLATKAERFGHELSDASDAPVSTGVGDIAAQEAIGARRVRRADVAGSRWHHRTAPATTAHPAAGGRTDERRSGAR
jgi:hypothetical protein